MFRAAFPAAVSLLHLGDTEAAHAAILNALNSENNSPIIGELTGRPVDKSNLTFAQEILRKIANDASLPSGLRDHARSLSP